MTTALTSTSTKNLTEQFLDDWLEDEHHKATERLRAGKHTHEDLTIIMLKHQTNHISHLEQDLRGDIANVRTEIADVRAEIADVRSEITDLLTEMRSEITDIRKDLKDMGDKLNDKIQGLTWRFITAMGMFMGINTTIIGAFIAFAKFW